MEVLLYIAATFGVLYLLMAWCIGVEILKAGMFAGDFKMYSGQFWYEVFLTVFAPIVLPWELVTNLRG